MKILKLLNKKSLSIIFVIFFYATFVQAEEKPVDIWNIDKDKIEQSVDKVILLPETEDNDENKESSIYEMQTQKKKNSVEIDPSLLSKKVKMDVTASVTNVYNRENIFYFNRIKYERVNQLPIMPSIGANITF